MSYEVRRVYDEDRLAGVRRTAREVFDRAVSVERRRYEDATRNLRRELAEHRRERGAKVVDAAIERGAITRDSRETVLRLYEEEPDAVAGLLDARPDDPVVAAQNQYRAFWADDENERLYREYTAAGLGVRPEDVV